MIIIMHSIFKDLNLASERNANVKFSRSFCVLVKKKFQLPTDRVCACVCVRGSYVCVCLRGSWVCVCVCVLWGKKYLLLHTKSKWPWLYLGVRVGGGEGEIKNEPGGMYKFYCDQCLSALIIQSRIGTHTHTTGVSTEVIVSKAHKILARKY